MYQFAGTHIDCAMDRQAQVSFGALLVCEGVTFLRNSTHETHIKHYTSCTAVHTY